MPSEKEELTDEEKVADFLVRAACRLNKQCENRVEGDNHVHAYSGYAVDMPSLESAIFAPFQVIMGQERRPGIYDRAAALLVHIAKAHAFHDGNKRTALHLAIFYLRLKGITVRPTPNAEAGADLVISVTSSEEDLVALVDYVSTTLVKWTTLNRD